MQHMSKKQQKQGYGSQDLIKASLYLYLEYSTNYTFS
jgi:hypothetical protein